MILSWSSRNHQNLPLQWDFHKKTPCNRRHTSLYETLAFHLFPRCGVCSCFAGSEHRACCRRKEHPGRLVCFPSVNLPDCILGAHVDAFAWSRTASTVSLGLCCALVNLIIRRSCPLMGIQGIADKHRSYRSCAYMLVRGLKVVLQMNIFSLSTMCNLLKTLIWHQGWLGLLLSPYLALIIQVMDTNIRSLLAVTAPLNVKADECWSWTTGSLLQTLSMILFKLISCIWLLITIRIALTLTVTQTGQIFTFSQGKSTKHSSDLLHAAFPFPHLSHNTVKIHGTVQKTYNC